MRKEQRIVLPTNNESVIDASIVENLVDTTGIILVYCNDDVIGTVVKTSKEYIFDGITTHEKGSTLSEILLEYPQYIFKYVTNE